MERKAGTLARITLVLLLVPRFLFAGAQGLEAEMKRLVEIESSAPDTGPGKVGIGDAYFDASKKYPKEKAKLLEKAVSFYAKAWPDLDPVWKDKMRSRFHKLAGLPEAFDKPQKGRPVKGWSIPDELWESYIFTGFGHGGKTCAQILPAGKKNEAGYTGFHSVYMPASEKKTYHVVFWHFTEMTDADGSLSVRFVDANQKQVSQSGPLIATDAPWWQKFEGDFVCPAGASRIQLNFTMMAKTGATFIDDVSVTCEGKELVQNGSFE